MASSVKRKIVWTWVGKDQSTRQITAEDVTVIRTIKVQT